MTKISATSIRKALKLAQFDPKKDRASQILVDVGNYNYYLTQAQILISDAKGFKNAHQDIVDAIRMLAIALIELEETDGPLQP